MNRGSLCHFLCALSLVPFAVYRWFMGICAGFFCGSWVLFFAKFWLLLNGSDRLKLHKQSSDCPVQALALDISLNSVTLAV